MSDDLLTCLQASKLLAVRPATIRAWTARRKIPSIKLGGRAVRYRRADLERFIRQGERPALRPHRPADEEGGAA